MTKVTKMAYNTIQIKWVRIWDYPVGDDCCQLIKNKICNAPF
jgi:hypothetical protein